MEMGQDPWTTWVVPRHPPFLPACTPTPTISHFSQVGTHRLPGHVDNNWAMELCANQVIANSLFSTE